MSVRAGCIWRGALTCLVVVLTRPNPSAAQSHLYGVRHQNFTANTLLERVDTSSGASTTYVLPGPGPGGVDTLAFAGDRLLGISILNAQPDRFTHVHPADAAWQYGALTGFNGHAFVSLDYDSTRGIFYYTGNGQSLYKIDPATGVSVLVGHFSGLSSSASVVTCFAIYPDGTAIAHGLGPMSLNAPLELYALNLQSADLSPLPGVVVPNALGKFDDLAVDSNGELWGTWETSLEFQHSAGLYHIDVTSWTVTHVRHVYPSYTGIAFVPDTQQSAYCTAKINSLGCAPSITADGFPSPTASSGYVLRATNVRNQSAGSLTFGLSGRAALPFGGGVNCLVPPRQRTPVSSSGGSPATAADCSGAWQLDFNAWMAQFYTLPAGTTVQAQWFGRDLGFAPPNNWTLSDALEFTVRP